MEIPQTKVVHIPRQFDLEVEEKEARSTRPMPLARPGRDGFVRGAGMDRDYGDNIQSDEASSETE
jgi:hypothetical protein